jgi:tetratricopeptide (TPR) repeat protein
VSDTTGPWKRVDAQVLESLRLEEARQALARNDPHTALVEAEELLYLHPHQIDALTIVAEAASAMGDAWTARIAYGELRAVLPDDVAALRGLMVAEFECLDYAKALESGRALAKHEPSSAEAWYFQGLAHERLGREADAKRCIQKAARLAPEVYPPDAAVPPATWKRSLERARALLPGPFRAFLKPVAIEWRELPTNDDLQESEPNTSPFVDALYQGEPPREGDPWTEPPAAVRLFKGNLRRPAPRDDEELARRIAASLLREAADWLGVPEPELAERQT